MSDGLHTFGNRVERAGGDFVGAQAPRQMPGFDLDEIGLGWWAVDGETVQITTSDALSDLRVIEFHVVPNTVRDQFASTAAFISAMQEELSKLGDNVPESPTVMAYDEPSGRLLVLGSAAAHRYLTERFSPDARVAAHE